MKKNEKNSYTFSADDLKKDLLFEARSLRIHVGFAELIAEKVTRVVEDYQKSHPILTKLDIENLVYKELKKYHKDLAFIYHNRDKII